MMVVQENNRKEGEFLAFEGHSWMTSIEDFMSVDVDEGSYIPVLEAATITVMAALGADPEAIKRFYDSISDKPVTLEGLRTMIEKKTIYLLPKMERLHLSELSDLYERVRDIYMAA